MLFKEITIHKFPELTRHTSRNPPMLKNSKSTFRTIIVKVHNKGKGKMLKATRGKNVNYLAIRLTIDMNHSNNIRKKTQKPKKNKTKQKQWNNIIKFYGKIILKCKNLCSA